MRLLNAHTLKLELFHDSTAQNVQYATLSHTWGKDEVSFGDMKHPAAAAQKLGYAKIYSACKMTIAYGLSYVWVDTCCIDKSSSAELSEAINSMFRWYKNSTFCFAYLSDLPRKQTADQSVDQSALGNCRWFTRGWTLQELIAPKNLVFFDQNWNHIGTKYDLKIMIKNITNISHQILDGSRPLSSVAIAKRMSWASHRKTTRVEDEAYCLLGIFDINMPMIYGEGPRAFIRLQEEILRMSTDLSIFAWRALDSSRHRGIFAESPAEFYLCGSIELNKDQFRFRDEISLTNRGMKIHTAITRAAHDLFRLDLRCYDLASQKFPETLSIYLVSDLDTFYRAFPSVLTTGGQTVADHNPRTIYLARAVSDSMLDLLSKSKELRINFSFDEASRGSYTVENILAVPELFWDQPRQCFFLPGSSNFLCFVRFRIAPGELHSNLTPTSLLLCFNIFRGLELCLEVRQEYQFQSGYRNGKWQKTINPFTNIEDYGPLGDPFSLNAICPGKSDRMRKSREISLRDLLLRFDLDRSDTSRLVLNVRIGVLPPP